MAIFKCKLCGGALEINGAQTVAVCEYCGTKQTIPRLDDERRANLYDRANHFRRNNDFDKAAAIYETILNEDTSDAEAYWSLVLCRYGIEYVEDPATHRRIPTVNRAQFTSVFDDEDYKAAIAHADGYQREIYEAEAQAINEIQKGILAISQKEDPFDVFICYKETDATGRRTMDSVLATELYHELTREEGFKVFFSRITLENKLGVAYEPYIFAALHSAKVMVVIGTRPEHFNGVWVKNEWSRYLALIKNGAKKTLIPAYKDMDPYDLPEEFSHLQALDMSKLGFMQDLVHGIRKLVDVPTPTVTVVESAAPASSLNTNALLRRAFLFLEDGEFDRADEFAEQVLNQDPEDAEAYLVKLMADLMVRNRADLGKCETPFQKNKHYQKIMRFAKDALKNELNGYLEQIAQTLELNRLQGVYDHARLSMNTAKTEADFQYAASAFRSIADFKDSATLAEQCIACAEATRKNIIYTNACRALNASQAWFADEKDVLPLEKALEALVNLNGWRDTAEKIPFYRRKIDMLRERIRQQKHQAEQARLEKERKKKLVIKLSIIIGVVTILLIIAVLAGNSIANSVAQQNAIDAMNEGNYEEALAYFEENPDYEDNAGYLLECRYLYAKSLQEAGKYEEAFEQFTILGNYKDSSDQTKVSQSEITYYKALSLMHTEKYDEAIKEFEYLGNFKDCQSKIEECKNAIHALLLKDLENTQVGSIINMGRYSKTSNETATEQIKWLVLKIENGKALLVSKYIIDVCPYNFLYHTNWEESTICDWLNNDFADVAFSKLEWKTISTIKINGDYALPDTDGTQKVFLLSTQEVTEYMSRSQKITTSADYAYNSWWLRDNLKVVNGNGTTVAATNASYFYGVRPAIWIDLTTN